MKQLIRLIKLKKIFGGTLNEFVDFIECCLMEELKEWQ